jgi:hypothetical protein
MPKSKSRSKRGKTRGAQGKKSGVSGNTIAVVIAAVIIAGGGYSWWSSGRTEVAFMEDVASGKSILSKVKTIPAKGTTHLRPGQNYNYSEIYPTSGPHASRGTPPGFYDTPQRSVGLVHALEHGNIVIYYDKPGEKALEALRSWTALYPGAWDGVIATKKAGIGVSVVLTAWTKRLNLERFDRAAAAAFIDLFRGRGPENPVR